MTKMRVKTVLIITFGLLCTAAYSQDEPAGTDKWDIEFTPYFWAAELKGDATLRGRLVRG